MGKKKKQLIGYEYALGMHMIVSHPVDAVLRIDAGEKTIASGSWTSNTTLNINLPDLFGGKTKEGGIVGPVDLCFGAPAQAQNPYLISQLGADVPAFRGVMSFVVNQTWLTAMSQYIKPWQFLLRRIPATSWYNAKANINGDANAAHIIYDCFTNPSWGLGYPNSVLDLASFTACADTLYSEGLGLSLKLSNTDSIESFMQYVCKHIAGTLYVDAATGKFTMGLLRNDYNVATLRTYNESNIIELQSYEKPSPAEMVNEVVIKYRPQGTGSDDSVTAQDLASIQSQGGIVSTTIDLAGISNATNAGRVAARELRTRSTPLTRVKFVANRQAWQEKIGGVIKFSWTAHGVANMVLRIVGINFGTIGDSKITITAIEDVFGLPFAQYLAPQTSQWVDPVQPPSQLTITNSREATYWDIRRNMTDVDSSSIISNGSQTVVGGTAAQPTQASPNFEMWDSTSSTASTFTRKGEGPYAAFATTSSPMALNSTTVTLTGVRGIIDSTLYGTYGILVAPGGGYSEFVRIDNYDANTGTLTVGRGCIDTPTTEWPTGSYFIASEVAQLWDLETIFSINTIVFFKYLMRTANGLFPLASATNNQITTLASYSRHFRPYPPGIFKLSNAHVPTVRSSQVDWYGPLNDLRWVHRDRTQQLASLVSQDAASIGPEAGVTYTVRSWNAISNTVQTTITGISAATYDYSTYERGNALPNIRLDLWSDRGGVGSTYLISYTNIIRHGYGFNYGSEYGGVAA